MVQYLPWLPLWQLSRTRLHLVGDVSPRIHGVNASLKSRTNEDDDETVLIFDHFHDAVE